MCPEIRATYRLQLRPGFGFDEAAAVVDYLHRLGISHVYCSPYLQAAPGSAHGYDVVDHARINEELGGDGGLDRLCEVLADHGMGHVLDIVPNHMAADPLHNRRWWDVLQHGRASRYARFFDIDWDPPDGELRGRVLVPVLGAPVDEVVRDGELALAELEGEPVLRYHEHVFPIAPGTVTEPGEDVAALLDRQHYLLAFWRDAFTRLNYRRFFAINELVALRMEEPGTFEDVHALPLALVRAGKLDGLRVDHVDGLADPRGYLERLRNESDDDAYLVVEKILAPDERLPQAWPVEGTTGYDFCNLVSGLFVDPSAERAFSDLYARLTGDTVDLDALRRDTKLQLMRTELAPDLNRLAVSLRALCDEQGMDQPLSTCRAVIEEVAAGFDVYRTYVEESAVGSDAAHIAAAVDRAGEARFELPGDLFDFVEEVLTAPARRGPDAMAFARRFQQTTGPVMAKGVEDTLFYAYNRFAALNEVGGDPGRFGVGPDAFHDFCSRAARLGPRSMLATSTHDTKRSEDVRARLGVLSEIPGAWAEAVARWSRLNERHRDRGLPDRNAEYLLYQTLVGAWPIEPGREMAYMEKATKEAKVHTSWIDPRPPYDSALRSFVEAVCTDAEFLADLERFVAPLIWPGRVNSLSQTLIKLTAPGIPDLYQGTELWDLSLVDPDNRRPVDFEARKALLREIADATPEEVLARGDDGAPKLFVIQSALALRGDHPEWFGAASTYEPLQPSGRHARRVVAFARAGQVVAAVPRLALHVSDWEDTALSLPAGRWWNLFTGDDVGEGPVVASVLFERFPVALLRRA